MAGLLLHDSLVNLITAYGQKPLMPMLTYPARLEVYFLVWVFIYIHTFCVQAGKTSESEPKPLYQNLI